MTDYKSLFTGRSDAPQAPASHLTPPKYRLLLVDDEENILSSLRRLLRRDGYTILTATGGLAALELLATHPVDVIISDQRMPGMTGVEFLRKAKDMHPDSVRLMLSGYSDLQSVTDAINEGAIYKFLSKPWDDAMLRANIEEAFRRKLLANARLLVMLSGLGFVAHTVFFYVGLTDTTAINASALLSLTPIWIMLILLARGAPVTPVQWAGIVLSIAGRAHVGRPSDPGPWLGLGGAVLLLATLWRAIGAVHGVGWPVLAGAALLWCLAFGILAWRVAPGLWLARTDGKTGCAD